MTKIIAVILPWDEIHVDIGYGVYHKSNWIVGIGANANTFVPIQVSAGSTIPIIHIGTINNGLNATAPNITGSFILNIAGARQAFPKADNLTDFDLTKSKTNGNVHAIPPHHMYVVYIAVSVYKFKLFIVAVPAATKDIFAAILVNFTGWVTGVNTHVDIPIE